MVWSRCSSVVATRAVCLGAVTERAASALLLRSVPMAGPGTLLAVLRSARRHGRHGAVIGLGRAQPGLGLLVEPPDTVSRAQERILEQEFYRFVRFHYDLVAAVAASR